MPLILCTNSPVLSPPFNLHVDPSGLPARRVSIGSELSRDSLVQLDLSLCHVRSSDFTGGDIVIFRGFTPRLSEARPKKPYSTTCQPTPRREASYHSLKADPVSSNTVSTTTVQEEQPLIHLLIYPDTMPTSHDLLTPALRDLIYANHILHHHGVVDAYGHVSIRHPTDPSVYIMCGYMAPAMVSSPDDLIHYHVSSSDPVNPKAKKGYSERFIHGEIFKRFPSVQCVVHSHAEEVLPYVVSTGVPMRAVYHMAGFLGSQPAKVFDIAPHYRDGDQQDMLVRNARFGTALAEVFANNDNSSSHGSSSSAKPDETVVLMRRHGFTAVGENLVTTVYRAIYTRINAEAQTKAMAIARNVYGEQSEKKGGFDGLTQLQGEGCYVMCEQYQDKPWRLWVREVERNPLYDNSLSEGNDFA